MLRTLSLFLALQLPSIADSWPQPAGPNGNWQINGKAPTHWSAVRNENILWRTPMPEAGMSAVTVADDKVFTTVHVPIASEDEKNGVRDILAICLDAQSGEQLWQVTLPGNGFISLAGGFTDGTVFAPITDGEHVWFFNRLGSMGCYDLEGNEIWLRDWTPRYKHNNRQAEPFLIDDTLLYVEVANKELGSQIQKWEAPGVKGKSTAVPEKIDPKEVWTYIHGIDKRTGEVLWRESVGTCVHTTPVIGQLSDGSWAIAHARGGPHAPFEKPSGHSLTNMKGTTLWSTPLEKYDPSFACHFNDSYAFGFNNGNHLVFDINDGTVLHEQPLYTGGDLWRRDGNEWVFEEDVDIKIGKSHPNTNQANLVVGDHHWFLAHNFPYLGRVHIETGHVEYLELPAQLLASQTSRVEDTLLWGKPHPDNRPTNAQGFSVGDKGHTGSGFGHISAASPILIGHLLYCPVVTGTVYVIDTRSEKLTPSALIATNDLGTSGKTWTLSSLSFANGRIYAHTMREVICIGE